MKSFFVSIVAAIGSLFGMHSQPVQTTTNIPLVPVIIVQTQASQSTSSQATMVKSVSHTPVSPSPSVTGTTNTSYLGHESLSAPNGQPGLQQGQVVITFPLSSSVLQAGQTYNITWENESQQYPLTYSVYLWSITNGNVTNTYLGTVNSLQQTFTFKVPANTPWKTDYQINLYNGKSIMSGSQAFTIKSSE
jgi:hypothetical protein